jgi:hypothetical protein
MVIPASGHIERVVLEVSSLVEGSIPIRISTGPLKVRVVVVALVIQIEWSWWAPKVSIVEAS